MKWDKDKAWDGFAFKDKITDVLMKYITGAEKHQALKTSYGDLGVLLKKTHNNNGKVIVEYIIEGCAKGVSILNNDDGFECCITWNKAAKLIQTECRRIAGK